jgi:hypothetical protein
VLVGHRAAGRDEADKIAPAQAGRLHERRRGFGTPRRPSGREGERRGREPAPGRIDRANA